MGLGRGVKDSTGGPGAWGCRVCQAGLDPGLGFRVCQAGLGFRVGQGEWTLAWGCRVCQAGLDPDLLPDGCVQVRGGRTSWTAPACLESAAPGLWRRVRARWVTAPGKAHRAGLWCGEA